MKHLLEVMYNDKEGKTKWEDMEELKFYREIVFGSEVEQDPQEEEEEELVCDCLETDCVNIHI